MGRGYSCVVCGRNHRLDSKLGQEHYQATQEWLDKPREKETALSKEEYYQRLADIIYGKEEVERW